eukprot:1142435-Pelagomonas_calceolata.AAC.9
MGLDGWGFVNGCPGQDRVMQRMQGLKNQGCIKDAQGSAWCRPCSMASVPLGDTTSSWLLIQPMIQPLMPLTRISSFYVSNPIPAAAAAAAAAAAGAPGGGGAPARRHGLLTAGRGRKCRCQGQAHWYERRAGHRSHA